MSWRALIAMLIRDGVDLDRAENAALGGAAGQTISMREALARKAGHFSGVLACAFLSVAVQWRHCAKQLAQQPMGAGNYARAVWWLLLPVWFPAIWWHAGLDAAAWVFGFSLAPCAMASAWEAMR